VEIIEHGRGVGVRDEPHSTGGRQVWLARFQDDAVVEPDGDAVSLRGNLQAVPRLFVESGLRLFHLDGPSLAHPNQPQVMIEAVHQDGVVIVLVLRSPHQSRPSAQGAVQELEANPQAQVSQSHVAEQGDRIVIAFGQSRGLDQHEFR